MSNTKGKKMDNTERYINYDDESIDELAKPQSKLGKIIVAILLVVCFAAVAVIIFRIVLFNYYPGEMKRLYVDEKFSEFYKANNGDVETVTQDLRFGYDNNELGNFWGSNLIIVKNIDKDGSDRVQITVRFNVSALEDIKERYGIEGDIDPDSDFLDFAMYKNDNKTGMNEDGSLPDYKFLPEDIVGEVVHVEKDSFAMYRYYKLVFDGIQLDGGDEAPKWLSLGVFVKGYSGEEPYANVLIYENHDEFSEFEEYKLSSKERPE